MKGHTGIVRAIGAAALISLPMLTSPAPPGADLRQGMQLIYTSNGVDQPAWEVDAVRFDVPGRETLPCVEFLMRRGPGQAAGDTTRLCQVGDTLHAWSFTREMWLPQRPVLPTTVLTVDSLGKPRRRLRERYALSLATATEGTFEIPDSAGGWIPQQHFVLREIRRP